MSRVSFNQVIATSISSSRDNAEKLYKLQRQMTTGMQHDSIGDDPSATVQIERFHSRIRRDEQVIRNVDLNQRYVDEGEINMTTVIERLQRARTLAVQTGNDTYVTADTEKVAAEINQILEGIVGIANSRSVGRTFFAGAKIDDPAFDVTRDNDGEITEVAYAGDELELEIDADGRVPVTWPGDKVFARAPQQRQSTAAYWNGSTSSNYSDRELAAAFIPSSGVMDGKLKLNGITVQYDLDGNPSSGEGDSLRDLADSINAADTGVRARVTGVIESNTASASWVAVNGAAFSTLGAGFTAGTITVNGASITVNGNDTIFTLAQKINSSGDPDLTAEIYDSAGQKIDSDQALTGATLPLRMRLSGGVEIGDVSASSSNIMRIMGITKTPVTTSELAGHNLTATVLENYSLQLTGDRPGPFTLEDETGSLAADLGLTADAGIVEGGLVFETLVNFRTALREDDSKTIRETILGQIDDALGALEISRTEAGTRSGRLEQVKFQMTEVRDNHKKFLAEIEEADLTQVVTDLNMQQAAQSAALRATASLMQLSLLNFLS